MAHCISVVCTNNIVYARHLLSSGCLEFWNRLGSKCLCDQPPVRTLGTKSLMRFPGSLFYMNFHISLLKELDPGESRERTVGSLGLWTSPTPLHPCPFSLILLCVFFAVINHSYGYNCLLSPKSPSSKSSNLRMVSGTSDVMVFLSLLF